MNLIIEIPSEGNTQPSYYCEEKVIPITFKKEEATKFRIFDLKDAFQKMLVLHIILGLNISLKFDE
jgi:hypothetical protein